MISSVGNSAARTAEAASLAMLDGLPTDDLRECLSLALREAETERNADALRRYRAGEPILAWPKVAPWSGF